MAEAVTDNVAWRIWPESKLAQCHIESIAAHHPVAIADTWEQILAGASGYAGL